MKSKPFRIAALILGIALLLVALLSGPATAEPRRLLVTLMGGRQVTLTVDAAPGTPVASIPLPDLGMPVVSVSELASAAPPVTTVAPTTASTGTTITGPPTTITGPATTGATTPATTTGPDVGGVVKPKGQPKGETSGSAVAVPPTTTQSAGGGQGTLQDASGTTSATTPSQPDGAAPTPSAPGFTVAPLGPAPLGVPNFFIDNFRIPPFLLPIYQAAGIQYSVPWQVLAAINEIETDYGRNLSVSSAGAIGWMQFMPSSWATYGVDANGDGVKDPYNPVDAIFAAARYLKAAGADTNLSRAIFSYNHADWYVQSVLLRARVIGGMPADLVGSLTGLTEGHFPVAARATYADGLNTKAATRRVRSGNAAVPVDGNPARRSINVFARAGAPVIAVNDGRIVKLGQNAQLGNFVVLEDVYGNRYTYAHLGSLASKYPVPKPQSQTAGIRANTELELPKPDAKPTVPATAGAQPTARAPAAAAPQTGGSGGQADAAASGSSTKERLFAHPERPAAYSAGGKQQLAELGQPLQSFNGYFTEALQLDPRDYVLKPLQAGSSVIAGTILGRIGKTDPALAPHVEFSLRPAGRGAPLVDPKPILDGWKLLESTAIYRANGKNAFAAANGAGPSIGQVLLMSKEQLQQRVLADPNVDVYACGRQDIASGRIDRRVLATLEFLVASGLKPTVSALECGHSYLTTSGNVSEHSTGDAVDIAAVNGIPIAGHQGSGSITDITIRRLLTLQGAMKPHQIISLMTYPGTDNTLALPDHWNHIHVGFHPEDSLLGNQKLQTILKPSQWTKLVQQLASIPNPVVPQGASKYAIKDGPGD
jgi:hypothetical protein